MYFFIPRLATLARQAFGLPRSLRGSKKKIDKQIFSSVVILLFDDYRGPISTFSVLISFDHGVAMNVNLKN